MFDIVGFKAELTIDADNGEAVIGLKAKLRHLEFKMLKLINVQVQDIEGRHVFVGKRGVMKNGRISKLSLLTL